MVATLLGQKQTNGNQSGDYVLQSQQTGKDFRNVSQTWINQCTPFDKILDRCAKDASTIQDIRSPLKDWSATSENGKFGLKNKSNGKFYTPSPHALVNMCYVAGISNTFPTELSEAKRHTTKTGKDGEKVIVYNRDKRDTDLLVQIFNNTMFASDRVDQDKIRLFRTRTNDSTIRAVLSQKYAIINNMWYLELLKKIVPDGLFSHYRGDSDELYSNLLIPDSIRIENDSAYGGLLNLGNSEIGTRNISSYASTFRAICMNGCIHQQEIGFEIKRRHVGTIDLVELATRITNNIQKQIPLTTLLIQRQLDSIKFKCGSTPILSVMAQIAQDYDLNVTQMKGVMKNFTEEMKVVDKDAYTAFGIANAITRYGQSLNNKLWLSFDSVGGEIVNTNDAQWNLFLSRASQLPSKMINKLLGIAA